jgi:putative ABC transport system permease protein
MMFAMRSLKRRRLCTCINILGLSLGVAVTLIILLYVDFELSYDNFHRDSSSIYRVISTRYLDEEFRDKVPLRGYGMGPALKADVPEVHSYVRTHSMLGGAVVSFQGDENNAVREEKFLFADSTFFRYVFVRVFSRRPNSAPCSA